MSKAMLHLLRAIEASLSSGDDVTVAVIADPADVESFFRAIPSCNGGARTADGAEFWGLGWYVVVEIN